MALVNADVSAAALPVHVTAEADCAGVGAVVELDGAVVELGGAVVVGDVDGWRGLGEGPRLISTIVTTMTAMTTAEISTTMAAVRLSIRGIVGVVGAREPSAHGGFVAVRCPRSSQGYKQSTGE